MNEPAANQPTSQPSSPPTLQPSSLPTSQPSPAKGYLLAVASTASLGMVFIFSKTILQTLNRETFIPLWYLAGFLLVAAYLLLTGQARSLLVPRRLWGPVLAVGLLNSVAAVAFFWEIQLTDPTLVSFFGRMETVYTVLWGVLFLRERLNRREVAGMALTLIGALLITYAAGQIVLQAFLLSIFVETLFFSLAFLVSKVALNHAMPAAALAGYRSLLMSLLTAIYATLAGQWMAPTPRELLLIGSGAIFGPFLTWVLLMHALARADASKVAVIRNTQPVFVALYSLIIFGALPALRQMFGGALAVAGVILILVARQRR